MNEVSIIGLDLVKKVFHAHGARTERVRCIQAQVVGGAIAEVPG